MKEFINIGVSAYEPTGTYHYFGAGKFDLDADNTNIYIKSPNSYFGLGTDGHFTIILEYIKSSN